METPKQDAVKDEPTRKLNAQMLGKLVVVAFLMFGFGYALIPVYKKICEITGINTLTPMNATAEDVANTQVDKSRKITIEFDGNAQGPWRFRPTVASMEVQGGSWTTGTGPDEFGGQCSRCDAAWRMSNHRNCKRGA